MSQVHLYPLSRLVNAPAANWERLLKSIEEGKSQAFGYYLPMREAVVRFCEDRGKESQAIASEMVARARQMGGDRGPRIAKDNERAFRTFETVFYPQITRYRRHFLRGAQTGIEFAGITLIGSPHLEAIDRAGDRRYILLQASDWPTQDLHAYLELLAVIVKDRFGSDPSSIWALDLKRGSEIKWRSSARVRRRCESAARLYGRLIRALAE